MRGLKISFLNQMNKKTVPDIKTFVIGDIHGAYRALMQGLERAGFDYQMDRLICLGDVCDRGPEVNRVFDELLKIKKLIYLLGNHDIWALQWAETGETSLFWDSQGGSDTMKAYPDGMPVNHVRLLKRAPLYYEEDERMFVHGGIRPGMRVEKQDRNILLWDRSLVSEAMFRKNQKDEKPITSYPEIYVGHTPTINFGSTGPIHACEVWLMDTGAGWGGAVSLINVQTKEVFQSDPVNKLYSQVR